MPPTTYSGTVYNEVTHANEPNAKIVASRLSIKSQFYPAPADPSSETLAETRSGKNGQFILTTPNGYAQVLSAYSADGKLVGQLDETSYSNMATGGRNLVIKIH